MPLFASFWFFFPKRIERTKKKDHKKASYKISVKQRRWNLVTRKSRTLQQYKLLRIVCNFNFPVLLTTKLWFCQTESFTLFIPYYFQIRPSSRTFPASPFPKFAMTSQLTLSSFRTSEWKSLILNCCCSPLNAKAEGSFPSTATDLTSPRIDNVLFYRLLFQGLESVTSSGKSSKFVVSII